MDCRVLSGVALISEESRVEFNFFVPIRQNFKEIITGLSNRIAVSEGIAGEPRHASARWRVIDHLADRVLTTGSWTGILTLGTHASHVRHAVRVHGALWPTSFVRISDIVR